MFMWCDQISILPLISPFFMCKFPTVVWNWSLITYTSTTPYLQYECLKTSAPHWWRSCLIQIQYSLRFTIMAKYRQLGQEYSFSESFLSAILISKIEGNTAFGLKIQFSNLKLENYSFINLNVGISE